LEGSCSLVSCELKGICSRSRFGEGCAGSTLLAESLAVQALSLGEVEGLATGRSSYGQLALGCRSELLWTACSWL